MSWTRIDDQLHGHHKIKRAWKSRPALGLHLMALSYSACYDLGGRVPLEFVEEKLPNSKERREATDALVAAGLWERSDAETQGWHIHDWDEYNGTAKTREEMRAAKSAAGKKGAAARWGDGKRMAGCHSSANGTGMAPSPSPEVEVSSPDDVGSSAPAARTSHPDAPKDLADEITGILQRGIDGLTNDEPCKRPTRAAVVAALGDATELQAKAAAIEARSIAQSHNRAPNIAALFAQRLAETRSEGAAA